MKSKINKKELRRMINSGMRNLSTEDIKKLIEAEAAKSEDKIDTEYIDLCFALLSARKTEAISDTVCQKPTFRTSKALLIAAIIITVVLTTVTTSAAFFNFNIPEEIAMLINGDVYFDMNFDNADTTSDGYSLLETDFAKGIAANGISTITVPEEIVNGNCTDFKFEYPATDKNISVIAFIDFKYKEISGNMIIEKFAKNFDFSGEDVSHNVKQGEMINVNGLDVFVFERNGNCSLRYRDNLTDYRICLNNCDFQTAIEFAKTIK